jgi:cell division protein FtsN
LAPCIARSPHPLSTQAADMRAADEKRCASGTLAQQEAEKAARDSHHSNAIDLTDFDFGDDLIILDDGPSGSTDPHASRSTGSQPSSGSQSGAIQRRPPGVNVLTKPRPPPVNKASKPSAGPPWTCPTCTLINEALALQCGACLAVRPSQIRLQAIRTGDVAPAGWTCDVCGVQGMDHQFWTCRFCGSAKTDSTFG